MCNVKIYVNERIVELTEKHFNDLSTDNCHQFLFTNKKELAKRLKDFDQSNETYLYVIHHDLDELFAHVAGCFKYLEAAGGLVTLPDGRILFIERLGKWDLPKGKAEKGETLEETAIREVMEECGLKQTPIITGVITHTYHTYHRDGKHILKHTAWYKMLYNGDDALHPQASEDITRAVWLHPNQLEMTLQNTYESIKQVIMNYEL